MPTCSMPSWNEFHFCERSVKQCQRAIRLATVISHALMAKGLHDLRQHIDRHSGSVPLPPAMVGGDDAVARA